MQAGVTEDGWKRMICCSGPKQEEPEVEAELTGEIQNTTKTSLQY